MLRSRLYARLRDETAARRHASAVVFAPHPDDETLGCGGTIAIKRDAGTPVACVFMTDGSTSHRAIVPAAELRDIRMGEARDAAQALGVSPGDVHFLDYPDGRLDGLAAEAADRVRALLDRYRPQEVYVPYRRDGVADHEATYAIVLDASRRQGRPLDICEYPVWAWNRWPWVPLRLRANRDTLRALSEAFRGGFGRTMLREFRSGVDVRAVRERKRIALSRHLSQMTVLRPGTAWPTLGDVSGGAFLECFFGDYELFRCTRLGSG